eukprot:g1594.t1
MPKGSTRSKSSAKSSQPYFVDKKKGEVNELRRLLTNVKIMRVPKSKRDVIKKVIAYMTLGIDVSRLFTEMIMASSTKDIVVKKMVYQYLCTYATQRPDLAILCINTLRNDCKDDDPVIRGLALRSLCGLRLTSIIEYLYEPLMSSLKDPSPYVRKTAIMGCLKLYHVSPETFHGAEGSESIVDKLYQMLRDRDSVVVANAIVVLTEVMHEEGGMAINQQIIHHLLNRIKNFNEWGQCIVLELVARYEAKNRHEILSIMNLLDTCLHIANSAVVIAAAKCFIRFASVLGRKFQGQVYQRLKQPLITLTAVPSFEIDYCVYKHIAALVARPACKGIFDGDFKSFFCRYNDPTCVKLIKMDILPHITNRTNMLEIIAELSEYVSGVDAQTGRRAIRAIGDIGVQIEASVPKVVERLLEFSQYENFVRAETVVVLKDLLRKYPRLAKKVIPSIHQSLTQIDEAKGKAAVIWMIGEYGDQLEEAPYVLESLVAGVQKHGSKAERLELLTAAMKLFFKRPPEMQKLLGTMLSSVLDADENPDADLHDRALFFYRLLREDVDLASKIVSTSEGGAVRAFSEEVDNEMKERTFKEFNTLSILYDAPADSFTKEAYLVGVVQADAGEEELEEDVEEEDEDAEEDEGHGAAVAKVADGDDYGDLLASNATTVTAPSSAGDDDLLGLLGVGAGDVSASTAATEAEEIGGLVLKSKHKIQPKIFQRAWMSTKESEVVQMSLSRSQTPAQLENALKAARVFCMASGTTGKNKSITKFFMYSTDADENLYMLQVLFDPRSRRFKATCKSGGGRLGEYIGVLKGALGAQ